MRRRIKERARQLTDENLLSVLMIRKEQHCDPAAKDSMSAASTTPRVPRLRLTADPASSAGSVHGHAELVETAP